MIMDQSRSKTILSLATIAAGWLFVCTVVYGMFTAPPPVMPGASAKNGIDMLLGVNERVSRAMTSAIPSDGAEFNATAESPFRLEGSRRQAQRTVSAAGGAAAARPSLALKGLVLKDKALAIIEDSKGQTFILGVNDTIAGQRVVSIKADRIVLRDRAGAYDLSVQE